MHTTQEHRNEQSHSNGEGGRGQVSFLKIILPYRKIIRLLKMTLSSFSPSHPLLSSKEGSFSFSFILILGLLLSYNIHLLERQLTHAHFPISQFYKSFSLLQGEVRQGWGNLGRSLRQNWSTRGVCVKAGVRSSGQRGQAGWAGLGVEGALQPVWLLPSSSSHPSHSSFAPTS